jgi:acyl carrier protein
VFDDDDLVLTETMVAADVPAWDSLAHVNFIYGIEEAFDVQFSEEEFVGFANVGELKRIVSQKIGSG